LQRLWWIHKEDREMRIKTWEVGIAQETPQRRTAAPDLQSSLFLLIVRKSGISGKLIPSLSILPSLLWSCWRKLEVFSIILESTKQLSTLGFRPRCE
jgi:hypothetical protein